MPSATNRLTLADQTDKSRLDDIDARHAELLEQLDALDGRIAEALGQHTIERSD